MNKIIGTCELCGCEFETDGYQWLCSPCEHPKKDCECGSDDVRLGWDIPLDQNGNVTWKPMWATECQTCERTTAWLETPKEAHDAWINGHVEKVLV